MVPGHVLYISYDIILEEIARFQTNVCKDNVRNETNEPFLVNTISRHNQVFRGQVLIDREDKKRKSIREKICLVGCHS